jgi:antitoxin ChpS
MSETRVQKWGNSMALRIPAPILRNLGLLEGQSIALSIENGALVARPAQKRYTLAELLAQCEFSRPINSAEREWIAGAAVGLEDI